MNSQSLAIIYFAFAAIFLILVLCKVARRQVRRRSLLEDFLYAVIFLSGGIFAWMGRPWGFSIAAKELINSLLTPPVITSLGFLFLAGLVCKRSPLLQRGWLRHVPWLLCLAFILALEDFHFARLVLEPDHIAVVFFLFGTLGFVTLGLNLASENDDRQRLGLRPVEDEPLERERIFVWPDLVYIEFLAMLGCLALLFVWSLLVPAPLEPPADPNWTPNPARAPWYFVGLQELLVYFDPWLAGVMIPVFIILGLCLIPYVDTKPNLSGYYGLQGRTFASSVFLGGLFLWGLLIVIGTFYRGPDWEIYGLFESHQIRKTRLQNTAPLSERIWDALNARSTARTTFVRQNPLIRESPGLLLLLAMFGGFPLLVRATRLASWFPPWRGSVFWLMMFLLMMMVLIPVKMYLNWIFDVSYIVWFPEIGLNI